MPRKPPKMLPRKPNCGAAAAGPRAATTARMTARLLGTGIMDRGLWLLQLGLEKEDNVDVGRYICTEHKLLLSTCYKNLL